MKALFKILSSLPLWLLHGCGWALGWVAFLSSGVYRRRFLDNAAQARISRWDQVRAIGEAGKLIVELPRLWLGRPVAQYWQGEAHVAAALQAGRGIVFLTPHLGCFEITAQAYAQKFGQHAHPMTVLFRPPSKKWLRTLVSGARTRPGLHTASTSLMGVKQLIKALKNADCVGLLPDQVPPNQQGVWAPFFGKAAYTMTLSARLALQTNATVLLAWGERLRWGRGYRIHVQTLPEALSTDLSQAVAQINHAMETLIQTQPSQYLWGYARYKAPRDAAQPNPT
jgi:KDO2-lipid IV(A) lauroyltransferase